jgi:Cu-processing system permease protein
MMLVAIGSTMRLAGYQVRNLLRSRWLIAYTLFFLIVTETLLRFGGTQPSALLGVANIILLVVPLVTLVFGAMYVYESREFTELLLAQPIGRRRIFVALHLGLAIPLIAGFAAGIIIPLTVHGAWAAELRGAVAMMLAVGVALTLIFTGFALWIATRIQDKVRGLGAALVTWLGCGVLYDGLVLIVATVFADYPLERSMLGLVFANPIDLGRVLLLLRFDIAALMGYTGAVFERFFDGMTGLAVAAAALGLWALIPAWRGMRAFQRKDF